MQEFKTTDEILEYAEQLGFGDIHFYMDRKTGLRAIVAIHSTKLGPALGGCRCIEYPNFRAALQDAVRLAHGMSMKAAVSNLAYGGGKSVLVKPKVIEDRAAYFQSFGKFVDNLNGRYITAMDSGTDQPDMDNISKQTSYVSCVSMEDGDPSPYTAIGVLRSIEAAVKFHFGRDDLDGLHVAIQGVGHVGYHLAKDLHDRGVKLTVCDRNKEQLEKCQREFGATVVSTDDIYNVDCDVFSPCALGGVLDDVNIPKIKAEIIAGSANNQLESPEHGQQLWDKNILYIPDYVANAGGLIRACAEYEGKGPDAVADDIVNIYDSVMGVLDRSQTENKATNFIADQIAHERLQ